MKIEKQDFFYDSSDKITKIYGKKWIPEGEIKAIIQISHGMVEHIERYDEFAVFLAKNGYLVCGNDHLGHGKSVINNEKLGYFAVKDGNKCVIEDIHTLRTMMQEEYRDLPYFILGHSMGSFLLRQYIGIYGEGLLGAIIMGTGENPAALLNFGKAVCRVIRVFKGENYRSSFINNLVIGSNNKHFAPVRTRGDWLSRDEAKVDEYCADPLCDFVFTENAFYNMFDGMIKLSKSEHLKRIPKNISLYILSGEEDLVGAKGKGPKLVFQKLKAVGVKNVELKLYPGARHEILNEINRQEVFEDIRVWLEKTIQI